MDTDLLKGAVERTQKTWTKYFVAICTLHVAFLIDALSKFPFLYGNTPIDLGGFKVVREAISATYGILFTLFVVTSFLESRLLKNIWSADTSETSRVIPKRDLWFLSPFSRSTFLRVIFWLLFIDGFVVLGWFSLVHLANIFPSKTMSLPLFVSIGVVDLILLFVCIWYGSRTYRNLQDIRSSLLPNNK